MLSRIEEFSETYTITQILSGTLINVNMRIQR